DRRLPLGAHDQRRLGRQSLRRRQPVRAHAEVRPEGGRRPEAADQVTVGRQEVVSGFSRTSRATIGDHDMSHTNLSPEAPDRRTFLTAAFAAVAGVPALALQQGPPPAIPPEQPRDWSGEIPVRYPDPDIVALDNRFRRSIVN